MGRRKKGKEEREGGIGSRVERKISRAGKREEGRKGGKGRPWKEEEGRGRGGGRDYEIKSVRME